MSHGATGHSLAAGRPRSHLPPIEALLVKLEELDDYSHIALRQYPKSERHLLTYTKHCDAWRTTSSILSQLTLTRELHNADPADCDHA